MTDERFSITPQETMVYNFALRPLVLHTFHREDATRLSDWVEKTSAPSPLATFFNIHPADTILSRYAMKILMITNEYPPNIYGGAGVHVDYLCRELARLDRSRHELQVMCFGNRRETGTNVAVTGVSGIPEFSRPDGIHNKVMDVLGRNIAITGQAGDADIVHCHTWYTFLAGCLIRQFMEIPMVITVHSLEPRRPWKREQIGTGYNVSSWLEKTAMANADGIIAVSRGMKNDILNSYQPDPEKIRVIYNGIDTGQYRKMENPDILASYGINPLKPFVLFVGRITRQKGIIHLVHALPYIREGVQIVLCAGAPDTEAIAKEMRMAVDRARAGTPNDIIWIPEMVPVDKIVAIYSQAALFVCPSVYEPFGIINLEAMACNTPVVAAAVGGIPEVVVHGQTGILVPFQPVSDRDPEPLHPDQYARDLAAAINDLMDAPEKREFMGVEARQRVEAHFDWKAIARQTMDYYEELRQARSNRNNSQSM
ncbi:MAG: glycogen synthase [Desulfatirhabdiaceae bacterium]